MTLQQAKDYTMLLVKTPIGNKILYGYNISPNIEDGFLLFFYEDGVRVEFFNIDCSVL